MVFNYFRARKPEHYLQNEILENFSVKIHILGVTIGEISNIIRGHFRNEHEKRSTNLVKRDQFFRHISYETLSSNMFSL